MTPSYTLRVGYSADGYTLHRSEADPEEGFPFPDLEAAQQEGDRLAGRTLLWARNGASGTWIAVVGDGRVAEISLERPPAISFDLGLMDSPRRR